MALHAQLHRRKRTPIRWQHFSRRIHRRQHLVTTREGNLAGHERNDLWSHTGLVSALDSLDRFVLIIWFRRQITHIQFLTLLYPSRLEKRLVFAVLGKLE